MQPKYTSCHLYDAPHALLSGSGYCMAATPSPPPAGKIQRFGPSAECLLHISLLHADVHCSLSGLPCLLTQRHSQQENKKGLTAALYPGSVGGGPEGGRESRAEKSFVLPDILALLDSQLQF